VDRDEWSGTLFYKTEGELGEENFKIMAEELYLQDIGTSTYTEYDPANPDFIKFLMENPGHRMMKQGHIHSHNSMAVFFSGTDTDELSENSEFHNYYLSLIVNNKNEMVAKVAFRGEEVKEVKSTVTYRGSDGNIRTREATSTVKETCVYAYDCDIYLPELVGESFEARFLHIKEETEKKTRELAKKATEINGARVNPYGGFSVDRAWSQSELYGTPETKSGKGKNGKGKKDTSWLDDKPVVVGVPDYSARRQSKDTWDARKIAGMKAHVYNFLVKLLSQDYTSEERLSSLLDRLEKTYILTAGNDINTYCDRLERTALPFYVDSFPEDFHASGFEAAVKASTSYLEAFAELHPELVANITEALNMCVKDEQI